MAGKSPFQQGRAARNDAIEFQHGVLKFIIHKTP